VSLVELRWFDTGGPRSFYTSFFLVAVVVGTIVDSYRLVMALEMLSECGYSPLLGEVDVELEVRGTFGPLL